MAKTNYQPQIDALNQRVDALEARATSLELRTDSWEEAVTALQALHLGQPAGPTPEPPPPDPMAGWTTFTPHANTMLIYVDATNGDDGTGAAMDPDHAAIGADPFTPVTPASVTSFKHWEDLTGTATSAHAGTVLTDTAATFQTWGVTAGQRLDNTSDGSTCTVTTVDSETQITHSALSGGTQNDWDIGESYALRGANYYVTDNQADWILFLKGETWNENFGTWTKSGLDADNRMVIASWDDGGGGDPPKFVQQGSGSAFFFVEGNGGGQHYLHFVDLEVEGNATGDAPIWEPVRGNTSYITWEGIKTYSAYSTVTGNVTSADAGGTTLTDSGGNFIYTNAAGGDGITVGDVIENTTDGSSAVVVSIDSDTQITHTTLTGGTDNDWDSADAYTIHVYNHRGHAYEFQNNGANPHCHHISWIRCITYDCGQGILMNNTDDVTVDQCIWDHNGGFGRGTAVEQRTHNLYLSVDRNRTTIRDNINIRASGFCQKIRGPWTDNILTNNCFGRGRNLLDCIIQSQGETNTNGTITGNAFFGPSIVGSGADGIFINGTQTLTISDNVFFRTTGGPGNIPCISFAFPRKVWEAPSGNWTDISDVTVSSNRWYEWAGHGIFFEDRADRDLGYTNITISGNDFDMPNVSGQHIINHDPPLTEGTGLSLSTNDYWSDLATGQWFELNNTNMNYTTWSSNTSDSSTELGVAPSWVDSSLTLETYNTYDGGAGWPTGPASEADFVLKLRALTKDTWSAKYEGDNMATYFKDGYTVS